MAADIAARPARSLSLSNPAWRSWAGGLLAVGLAAVTLLQLSESSSQALAMVQRFSPALWGVFVLLYLVQPLADLVIFRRLWRLPLAGLGVMMRKVVINETLFGYGGELYFYIWARRRRELSEAPFGTIKDVNVISALTANVLTLALLLVSAHGLEKVNLATQFGPALWPGLAHVLRLAITTVLTLLLWRMALPQVAWEVWLALMAGRLLLARLPFLPNRDLVFANLLLVLFGAGSPTALLLATLAIATLLAHLVVIVLVGSPDLLRAVGKAVRRA